MPVFSRKASGFRQSEPGGLLLPVHATLKGRVRWQVLDERGVPEVPRNEGGFAVGPAEGVDQDNLITDVGMDAVATTNSYGYAPSESTLRHFLAVGTGSTEPSVSDVALGNEVQRSSTSGSFSAGNAVFSAPTDPDVLRVESLATRLVVMTEDRNLTEFGFAGSGQNSMRIRELLRGAGGAPVAVSLLEGKSIKVDHTLVVDVMAPASGSLGALDIEEYDAGNNLIGSTEYSIIYGAFGLVGGSSVLMYAMAGLWNPFGAVTNTATNGVGTAQTKAVTGPWEFDRTATPGSVNPSGVTSGLAAMAWQPYVPGSHSRTQRATLAAGSGNFLWRGFLVFMPIGYINGFAVMFDDPATYTKASTDTLRLGTISTWGRA